MLALLFCERTAQATTNPTLAQRDISYFPPTGSTGSSTGVWKITLNNATIATDATPSGWSVRVLNEWPGKVFSVIAPQPPLQDAAIAANYQVFYNYTPTAGGGRNSNASRQRHRRRTGRGRYAATAHALLRFL